MSALLPGAHSHGEPRVGIQKMTRLLKQVIFSPSSKQALRELQRRASCMCPHLRRGSLLANRGLVLRHLCYPQKGESDTGPPWRLISKLEMVLKPLVNWALIPEPAQHPQGPHWGNSGEVGSWGIPDILELEGPRACCSVLPFSAKAPQCYWILVFAPCGIREGTRPSLCRSLSITPEVTDSQTVLALPSALPTGHLPVTQRPCSPPLGSLLTAGSV